MSIVNEWQHLKIPFHEIEVATENFKTLIGQGGYGSVFKGKLLVSGKKIMVAVKRLNEQLGQGLKEFLTEIQLLSSQQHPNLISLVGYCDEGREKSIVYEFAERGSLDQYISRTRKTPSTTLTWLQRLKICADVACGLDYLHRHVGGCRTIIHRDIKSSNILIDKNWVAKISDLGLSKLSIRGCGMSVLISNGCGTQGYCEPEYHTTGIVTKKSDVYSFGIVLFEVLCGRLCLRDRDDGFSLSGISAKEYYKNNSLDKIIDKSLRKHIGSYSMTKFSEIAYRCLHDDRKQRPAMDVVVKELEEALEYQDYEFKNEKKSKSIVVVEDDTDEYWETKLPEDLDSLIKNFQISHEIYTNKNNLFSYVREGIEFDVGYKVESLEKQLEDEAKEAKKWELAAKKRQEAAKKGKRVVEEQVKNLKEEEKEIAEMMKTSVLKPGSTRPVEPLEPKNWGQMNWFFEPIEPIEPIKPLEPKNWAKMNRVFEPIEPIEPIKPLEPKNWAKMNRFSEPFEPFEPIKPIKPIKPLKPLEPKKWA